MALGTRRKSSDKLAQFPVNFPSGTVIAFAGASAPEGWALCNGSLLNRTTNAALYAAIGDAHGNGDGSTTFHLPDYRGRLLRGVDGAAGRDADAGARTASNAGGNTGDAVGSVQGDQYGSHAHTQRLDGFGSLNGSGTFITHGAQNSARNANTATASSGGNETRPKNSNVNYIIKL